MLSKIKNIFLPKKPNKWVGLVLASLALAIVIIDGTVLNVSQADIIKDIGLSVSQSKVLEGFKGLQWAVTLYSLVVAALTIWGGRMADKYGKKRIFITGAVLFALGSLVTALSYYWGTSQQFMGVDFYGMWWLLIGWSVIEGVGAAMMLPATISLIVSNFEGKERSAAFGVWGATAGFSAALGPLVGGYFTTYFNWSWAFLINLFVVAFLILLSGHIVDKSEKQKKLKIDYFSVLLSALGVGSLTYGFIEASTYGWWKATEAWQSPWGQVYSLLGGLSVTPYAIVLGLVLIGLFLYRQVVLQRRGKSPLIDLSLFQSRQYSVGLVALVLFSIAFGSLLFALPLFLQIILGLDAFNSGLAFLPFSLASLVVAPLAGFFGGRFSPKFLVMAGIGFITASLAWVGLGLDLSWNQWSFVGPFLLMGVGSGLAQAQLGNLTLSDIEGRQSGEASGVQSAMRQLGQTFSSALIGSVFITALASNVSTNINNISATQLPPRNKEALIATYSKTQPLYSLMPSEQERAKKENSGRYLPDFIKKPIQQSMVDSSKSAMMAGSAAGLLALITTLLFHDAKQHPREKKAAAGH